ncbi:class I SAM-dependent methyltransferase [Methanolobus mangrovi]|uniref:Class I SAM-dependent methyltransferase n=1 Tax=Methanolobus mangrovi TaxID=3072977 RepID=A0AA51UE98_9EURY|nr:class I SAM-dependent methyltransferase [Methanolobus mangrovi]WMW21368.1 class I SAM-dependent methyltransferase [Methanolobus mangrovi]
MESQSCSWSKIEGKNIPTTVELDPIIYKYTFSGCRILDIGCANGKVSIPLALHGYSVAGVDINTEVLSMAKSSCKSQNCLQIPLFAKGNATILPFADATFDVAVMQAFLTTVISKENRARIIREACRVLKPQGHLYIADFGQTWHSKIYRERYINDLAVTKEEGSFLAYDQKTGELAYVAHHFTEKELVFLLIENGFEVEYFKNDEFVTRTGNQVNGFVVVGRKE